MSNDVYRVLIDTNVLLSRTLRDWVLILSLTSGNQFYRVFTSQSILDEFGYHWRRNNPDVNDSVRKQILARTRETLTVVEGYPIDTPDGYPDPGDLHVHSAAVDCSADALITDDKKLHAFAQTEKGEEQLPYEVMTCDEFLMQLTDYAPRQLFREAYLFQEEYWEKQATSRTLPEQLDRAGAPNFAEYLKQNVIHTLP